MLLCFVTNDDNVMGFVSSYDSLLEIKKLIKMNDVKH
jgi:hypothetical protein